MPPFQNRSRCFYCGTKSRVEHEPPCRWRCAVCEAVNHVDATGMPSEPPIEETSRTPAEPRRFTLTSHETSPPHDDGPNSPVFCSTCLKNQFIVYEALANYLPDDETSPAYAEYEAALPAYKHGLEQSYPPVCRACLPAARRQIEQAGYMAKSDYLRRLIAEKHRRRGSWDWAGTGIAAGAAGWWTSTVGGLAWDVLCAGLGSRSGQPPADAQPAGLSTCLPGVLLRQQTSLTAGCLAELRPIAAWLLILAWLSCWWSPYLAVLHQQRLARLRGSKAYYRISLTALAFRTSWFLIASSPSTAATYPAIVPGLHAISAVILLASLVWSRRVLQLDLMSVFSPGNGSEALQAAPASPSPTDIPRTPPSQTRHSHYDADMHAAPTAAAAPRDSFPLGVLRPQTQPQTPRPRPLSTPLPLPYSASAAKHPATQHDPDAMDWTPIPKPAQLFASTTPASPTPRLTTPATLRRAAATTAATTATATAAAARPGLRSGSALLRHQRTPVQAAAPSPSPAPAAAHASLSQRQPLSQPTFFPPPPETGLESLFDRAFSLSDEAAQPVGGATFAAVGASGSAAGTRAGDNGGRGADTMPPHRETEFSASTWYTNGLLIHVTLLGVFTPISIAGRVYDIGPTRRLFVMIIAPGIPLWNLVCFAAQTNRRFYRVSGIFFLAGWLALVIAHVALPVHVRRDVSLAVAEQLFMAVVCAWYPWYKWAQLSRGQPSPQQQEGQAGQQQQQELQQHHQQQQQEEDGQQQQPEQQPSTGQSDGAPGRPRTPENQLAKPLLDLKLGSQTQPEPQASPSPIRYRLRPRRNGQARATHYAI
ncbi:hypothetical protein KEM52_005879 [Ascosphaera acerosa]|nr:hypothetical protein KEM52_005879 [Ascosphaera acerosa]